MYSVYGSICSRTGIADYMHAKSQYHDVRRRPDWIRTRALEFTESERGMFTYVGILRSENDNLVELREVADEVLDPRAFHRAPAVFALLIF